MKISLLVLSWWCFSCQYILRIGIQYTDQLFWKNNTLGTVDMIFINKLQFLIFFSFFWFMKLSQEMGGGVIFITMLLHFHDFISLGTANTQKSEVFLLRISLGIVNACVTCWYLQIYNLSFRKEFLETL